MISRLGSVVVIAALALAPAATAQEGGRLEVGAFARSMNLDNSLGMTNSFGVGGSVSFYVRPSLAIELDVSRVSADYATGSSASYTPLRLRAVYSASAGSRIDALVGGGLVRNAYGDPFDASDTGLSTLLGLRYRLSERLSLRLGADADVMFHASSDSPFDFYTGNWGIHLGVSVRGG